MTTRKRILGTVVMLAVAGLVSSVLPFRLHLPPPLPTLLVLVGVVSFYLSLGHDSGNRDRN